MQPQPLLPAGYSESAVCFTWGASPGAFVPDEALQALAEAVDALLVGVAPGPAAIRACGAKRY